MTHAVLDGKYELEHLLGRGGMGEVWSGRNLTTGKRVAIKRLLALSDLSDELAARFVREARVASELEHANVVQVFDVGTDGDGIVFMVMEQLTGRDLAAVVQERGRLAAEEIVSLLLPILDALQHAHDLGTVHRDVKPENIYLADVRGVDGVVPKLLDFGIAKTARSPEISRLTKSGTMMGTPYYMSPEQMQDAAGVDGRADQYAVGVVLYEALAGRRPYVGDSYPELVLRIVAGNAPALASLDVGIPEALSSAVARAMATDAASRFDSMTAFAAALRSSIPDVSARVERSNAGVALPSARPAQAEVVPTRPSAPEPSGTRDSRVYVGVAALVIIGVAAIGLAIVSATRGAPEAEPPESPAVAGPAPPTPSPVGPVTAAAHATDAGARDSGSPAPELTAETSTMQTSSPTSTPTASRADPAPPAMSTTTTAAMHRSGGLSADEF